MVFENLTLEEVRPIISQYLGVPSGSITVSGELTYLYLDSVSPAEVRIQSEGNFSVTWMGQVDYGFVGTSTRQYGELVHGPWIYTRSLNTSPALNYIGGPRIATLEIRPWVPRNLHTMYSCPILGLARENGIYHGYAVMFLNEHPTWDPEGPFRMWTEAEILAVSSRVFEPITPVLEPGETMLGAVSVGVAERADVVVIEDALELTSLKYFARPPVPSVEEALEVLADERVAVHNPAGDSLTVERFGKLLEQGTIHFQS